MLTHRDKQILEALSRCVKVFSVEQVASTWWPESPWSRKHAIRRMSSLQSSGFVESTTLMVRPVQKIEVPIVVWKEGHPVPDMGALSYQLKHRWDIPPESTRVYVASRKSAQMFGGFKGKLRLDERSHDLVLSSVFLLKFREFFQGRAGEDPGQWISESLIRQQRQDHNQKLPDALLRPRTVIEVGGRYGKDKLEAFHLYCETNALHYEIW